MAQNYRRLRVENYIGEIMELHHPQSEEKGQEILSFILALHNIKQKSNKPLVYKLKAPFASPTEKAIKKANKLLRTVSTEVCPDDCKALDLKDVESFKSILRNLGIGIIEARVHPERPYRTALGSIAAFIRDWNALVLAAESEFLLGYGKIHCSKLEITELFHVSSFFNGIGKRDKKEGFPEALSYFKDEHNVNTVLASITFYQGARTLARARAAQQEVQKKRRSLPLY
ncbi:unnamed protein product [Orchesella dallaii]|uniref:Uncharacterized protein n=1 Tax=Orchesella dallaii TaxID=48710 RepID=A0ABP1PWX0_9HEXA